MEYSDLKPINEVIQLSDEDYIIYIKAILEKEDAFYIIDKLDDELLGIIENCTNDVERICKINSKVFKDIGEEDLRNFLLAFNYNTLMNTLIFQNKIEESKSIFIEGIKFCIEKKRYAAGESLSNNIFRLFQSNQVPNDEALYFFVLIKEFYMDLERYEDAIKILCKAAMHFADVSAFQSAYRALQDAQEIVISQKIMPKLQILILRTQGMVTLIEGDLSCAEGEFQKCIIIYNSIGEIPDFELRANIALIELRKKDFSSARDSYLSILDDFREILDASNKIQVYINLLVCYRELGDITEIEKISSQIKKDIKDGNITVKIEANLILSKTYFRINKGSEGTENLQQACVGIQEQIDQYQRLHYRRGVREHYISRIKSMLLDVREYGDVDSLLHVLVFCSSNALTDWISILEWIQMVLDSTIIPKQIKDDLLLKKATLIHFGTPFLYGFKEKYDDPFEHASKKFNSNFDADLIRQIDYSLPWREFNDLTTNICQTYAFPSPCTGASILNGVNMLKCQLSNSKALLFTFVCNTECVLILVAGKHFYRTNMPVDLLEQFIIALSEYQVGKSNRNSFNIQLTNFWENLSQVLIKPMGVIENSHISELIFIPDHLTEAIPVLPVLINSDKLRTRIKEHKFIFKTIPAIQERYFKPQLQGNFVFISNSGEELDLVNSEKLIINKEFNNNEFIEIDLLTDTIDFGKPPLHTCDVIHLASHSIPANIFLDPFFISTSKDSSKNSMWLETLQRKADELHLSLVVLNGCNTATTGNRNYFKNFLTNEKVGLTSAFLLNRKCSVIATQWNEPDVIGYIFTSIFYEILSKHDKAEKAFILTLTALYELTKEGMIELLKKINDKNLSEERIDKIKNLVIDFPFRSPYFLGLFQYHSLLSN